jgi:hypothetical protein
MNANIARESPACHHAYTGAHFLDHAHKRECPQAEPQEPKTMLGTGLAIGGDARRVVVAGASREPRPESFQ